MRFGEYLAEAITRAGLSQRQFALRVGYRQQNISQIVHGKRVPPIRHIDKWAKALGAAVDPVVFRQLALLSHCPPEIQEELRLLKEQLKKK